MARCSECKYLDERTESYRVSIGRPELSKSGELLHEVRHGLRPESGPPSPYAIAEKYVSFSLFTCLKVNKTISENYGFQKEYTIEKIEVNKDRKCLDFEKK